MKYLVKKASQVLLVVIVSVTSAWADYMDNPKAQAFIDKMVNKHGFERAEIEAAMAESKRLNSVVEAINRPAEGKPWSEYQDIFLVDKRRNGGVEFWKAHAETLAQAETEYGVPAQVIVSILGVETMYGRIKGSYRVIDTLVTQAFEFPETSWRSRFGLEQLEHMFLLAREQGFEPLELQGSYAGAMGYGQFIPSSYRAYAVDFDGDGIADIWNNPVDAIGSIANYLEKNGWRRGGDITVTAVATADADPAPVNRKLRADSTLSALAKKGYNASVELPDQPAGVVKLDGKQGDEYWLGLHNYFVITTYNRSRLYAMAAFQLSEQIKQAMYGYATE